ncbi:hypothetical protein HK098_003643 [Nowakowskiella sp. JEL0407]|nr:hypothetical protein HK098_003643 [Nowakowskiella sp. JEL0407]
MQFTSRQPHQIPPYQSLPDVQEMRLASGARILLFDDETNALLTCPNSSEKQKPIASRSSASSNTSTSYTAPIKGGGVYNLNISLPEVKNRNSTQFARKPIKREDGYQYGYNKQHSATGYYSSGDKGGNVYYMQDLLSEGVDSNLQLNPSYSYGFAPSQQQYAPQRNFVQKNQNQYRSSVGDGKGPVGKQNRLQINTFQPTVYRRVSNESLGWSTDSFSPLPSPLQTFGTPPLTSKRIRSNEDLADRYYNQNSSERFSPLTPVSTEMPFQENESNFCNERLHEQQIENMLGLNISDGHNNQPVNNVYSTATGNVARAQVFNPVIVKPKFNTHTPPLTPITTITDPTQWNVTKNNCKVDVSGGRAAKSSDSFYSLVCLVAMYDYEQI